jgi:aryl-alcohol dehydrogenase-like predicted oxidoreductase
MQLRSLGRGAVQVSAVGYGGMHLSTVTARPSETDAIRTLHAAFDAGVTLVDTADVYALDHTEIGHNERLVAKALASWAGARDAVVVATKGGMIRPDGRWERDARPERLRRACDRSLKALGVERIDLYQLHAPDHQVPFEESVGTLFELQREGKVRWVGLSNVSVAEIKAAEALGTVTSVQNSPTGGGRLTKRLPDHSVLAPMARELGVSAHALVIAWALAQADCVIPIPSARTPGHAVDSARAADLTLSARDLAAITAAAFDRT